jgi:large subunit ribosomal protein L25
MEFTVECEARSGSAKPRALRRAGLIPAVLYGHDGNKSVSLVMSNKAAEVLLLTVGINNSLVNVKVPELSLDCKALLREVQTHPCNSKLYHLSFFSVTAEKSLTVNVPLNFIGEAIGVTQGNGSLDKVLTSVQVHCSPELIPEAIDINVSLFNVGDILHISEMVLPQGVVVMGEQDRVVVSVLAA